MKGVLHAKYNFVSVRFVRPYYRIGLFSLVSDIKYWPTTLSIFQLSVWVRSSFESLSVVDFVDVSTVCLSAWFVEPFPDIDVGLFLYTLRWGNVVDDPVLWCSSSECETSAKGSCCRSGLELL